MRKDNGMDSLKWYCCKDCGTDDIMWSAYVDEHDKIQDIDTSHLDIWCNVCNLFCDYIAKEKYND
tara:strand:+ start:337 stop:531 length:195 start_codon:yes stop_codon:yes gene_type:complete